MNANISGFVICTEAIIYVLLYNLHDCTFKITQVFISIILHKNTLKIFVLIFVKSHLPLEIFMYVSSLLIFDNEL